MDCSQCIAEKVAGKLAAKKRKRRKRKTGFYFALLAAIISAGWAEN
jgi:hypothetical protein